MKKPAFVSSLYIDTDRDKCRLSDAGFTATSLIVGRRHYGVCSKTAAADDQSLLRGVQTALTASSASMGDAATFTVKLTTGFKVQITHNGAADKTADLDTELALDLGFTGGAFSIPLGASGVTATNYPRWLWLPGMSISRTGPVPWDPVESFGHPTSAGASHRAPDMTGSHTKNGVQWDSEIGFDLLQGQHLIKPLTGYLNQDLQSFWERYLSAGERLLWFRDQDTITGSAAPAAESAPPGYVQFQPSDELRSRPPYELAAPPGLYYWNVTLKLWLVPDGDTVL